MFPLKLDLKYLLVWNHRFIGGNFYWRFVWKWKPL